MKKRAIAAALAVASIIGEAGAATTPASGYLYSREVLDELTEGCIAEAPGGVFVGVGPALSFPASGKTRDIVFVSDTGGTRTVATGLNSISDCVYDAAAELLYVTDSGAEFSGATTGDTVFAIPGDAESVAVDGLELLTSGSIAQAFGIDLFGDGLLVSNAVGGGLGSVIEVDLSGVTPETSTFASGFDYTGGLTVQADRVLVSEAIQPAFQNAIYAYTNAGVFVDTLSGPTYAHGSVDLATASDGRVLASGSATLTATDDLGVTTPLVTGLDGGTGFDAYGGGIAVNSFTGRIDFLASSFSGADDDRSIHRLVPVDSLLGGGGSPATDCALELYGLRLVAPAEGKPARSAICVDGDACDADGAADGACTFPIGLCLNVDDERFAECDASSVASVEPLAVKPQSASIDALLASVAAAAPVTESTCFFSEGLRVPVRTLSNGRLRAGKGLLKLRATTTDARPLRDTDVVRLVCEPAP
jgi:hypothetical protein